MGNRNGMCCTVRKNPHGSDFAGKAPVEPQHAQQHAQSHAYGQAGAYGAPGAWPNGYASNVHAVQQNNSINHDGRHTPTFHVQEVPVQQWGSGSRPNSPPYGHGPPPRVNHHPLGPSGASSAHMGGHAGHTHFMPAQGHGHADMYAQQQQQQQQQAYGAVPLSAQNGIYGNAPTPHQSMQFAPQQQPHAPGAPQRHSAPPMPAPRGGGVRSPEFTVQEGPGFELGSDSDSGRDTPPPPHHAPQGYAPHGYAQQPQQRHSSPAFPGAGVHLSVGPGGAMPPSPSANIPPTPGDEPVTLADFDRLLALDKETLTDGWELKLNKDDVQVFKKKMPGYTQEMVKVVARLRDVPPVAAMDLVTNIDLRKKWDTTYMDMDVVDTLDALNTVIYSSVKAPMGVTNRDVLQYRGIRALDGGVRAVVYKGARHAKVPERKGFIRGQTLFSGQIVRPIANDPNSCEFTSISWNDLKGDLPVSIINKLASRLTLDWVRNLKKAHKQVYG